MFVIHPVEVIKWHIVEFGGNRHHHTVPFLSLFPVEFLEHTYSMNCRPQCDCKQLMVLVFVFEIVHR